MGTINGIKVIAPLRVSLDKVNGSKNVGMANMAENMLLEGMDYTMIPNDVGGLTIKDQFGNDIAYTNADAVNEMLAGNVAAEQAPAAEPAVVEPPIDTGNGPLEPVAPLNIESVGLVPVGKVNGSISPGTLDITYLAQTYNLSPEDYLFLVALVYSEAVENTTYLESDTIGVTSVILNRLESGQWGSSIQSVGMASGQFSGYGSEKFNRAMENIGNVKPEMIAAINRCLAGERNTMSLGFRGRGDYNKFDV